MGVDIILNRNARRLANDGRLYRNLLAAASRGSARVHETRTLHDLDRVVREIAGRGTDAVVLAGGDGSHMAGVSALSATFGMALPPVALAPCGTVCTVSRNFGIHGNSGAWATRLVVGVCSGATHIERKATLRVSDETGGDRVGFIFGAGLVARFFDVYYASSRSGLTNAAVIAGRVFAGSFVGTAFARRILQPTRCTASIDGVPHPGREWRLILASVVRDVGLHLLATYRGGEALDRFHVVASGAPPRALAAQAPRVLAGLPLRGDPRIDALARSLTVHFDATSGAYVLDGDVFHTREARVEPGPVLPLLLP
ncbi:MAG: hypothetical protein M3O46_05250 [Myxococcota bacterium]|nr:hypothetical protein [Myxococcota bacterium]